MDQSLTTGIYEGKKVSRNDIFGNKLSVKYGGGGGGGGDNDTGEDDEDNFDVNSEEFVDDKDDDEEEQEESEEEQEESEEETAEKEKKSEEPQINGPTAKSDFEKDMEEYMKEEELECPFGFQQITF